ncbi:MAG TPA: peptide deformylase [Candidatus Saccharimonadales bacterium]|nr:peptide deformylase [Candidatus Saccharimonadales bacterium]
MATRKPSNLQTESRPKDDIIHIPDPRLKSKSQRVGHIDHSTEKLAHHMIAATLDWEETREHEFGAALAAVQLGQLYRVIIIRNDFEDKEEKSFGVFINPEIIKKEGAPEEAMEGCLSVPDIYGSVARYPKVKVRALNLLGQPIRITATGFLARVLQHEIDHCEGILFTERIPNVDKLFKLGSDGRFTKYVAPKKKPVPRRSI